MSAYTTFNTLTTPQTEKASSNQTKNAAGGYTFTVTALERIKRFLIIGSDDGTYYTSAKDLTRDNAEFIISYLQNTDHKAVVDLIVEVSSSGRAAKNEPALFALALASSFGSAEEKSYALSKLSDVARTGTHLFSFATYVQQFRGWGRGLRNGVASWYTSKDANSLAYQAVKYRQRNAWTHKDLLRLSHPTTVDPAIKATLGWVAQGTVGEHTPRIIEGYLKAQEDGANYVKLLSEYKGLSWEMLPDIALSDAAVWEAIINNGMPQTALIRQLPRLTNLGLLKPMSKTTAKVIEQLTDADKLRNGRVHPVNLLVAQHTYSSGKSQRGSSTWSPTADVVDALEDAFYTSFGTLEPANKRTYVAVDVSYSMEGFTSNVGLSAAQLAAAFAMVTYRTEPSSVLYGFSHRLVPLKGITKKSSLQEVSSVIHNVPMGGTDCAAPMLHALKEGLEVDTFLILTDNETWAGYSHPHQALQQYRKSTGIDAKLITAGFTATESTIADPDDSGMLDVVGMDSNVPSLITEFSKGF